MNKDITNRKDIELLVNHFYEKIMVSKKIGPFFKKVVPVDLNVHLPVMYDFFENILFYSGAYSGNPLAIHMNVNRLSHLKKEHFDEWLNLFHQTVEELFEGQNATIACNRVKNIAAVMQFKIIDQPNDSANDGK